MSTQRSPLLPKLDLILAILALLLGLLNLYTQSRTSRLIDRIVDLDQHQTETLNTITRVNAYLVDEYVERKTGRTAAARPQAAPSPQVTP